MMKTAIEGVITALATPFRRGEVDKKSFLKLVRMQLDQGIQGFVINGTTGESPTLKPSEVKALFQWAKSEVAGQVPLLVGTGGNSTAKTCEWSSTVSGWKPDSLLVVVPYYNKPPQRGLRDHFLKIAKASRVPLVLYNVPSRTVAKLELATLVELARHPRIVGVKEASGDLDFLRQMQQALPKDFVLLSGDDATAVEFCARGGHGVISVVSHIIGRELLDCMQRKANAEFHQRFDELLRFLYIESNPIPLKAALYWQKVFASPELRLPLATLADTHHKEFKACLARLGKV